jgi:hypothetical protein
MSTITQFPTRPGRDVLSEAIASFYIGRNQTGFGLRVTPKVDSAACFSSKPPLPALLVIAAGRQVVR